MSTAPSDTQTDLLAQAVQLLTAAARGGPTDFAEFLTLAVAGAAANVGGIEQLLERQPGSWEAGYVRDMLTSTVGHDEGHLLEHRTEPIRVYVDADELLWDLGAAQPYDDAQKELQAQQQALEARGDVGEAAVDEAYRLEEALEEQQTREWADYAERFKANVLAAAAALEDLRVPVEVTIAPAGDHDQAAEDATMLDPFALRLWEQAHATTTLPGDGQGGPLERLQAHERKAAAAGESDGSKDQG